MLSKEHASRFIAVSEQAGADCIFALALKNESITKAHLAINRELTAVQVGIDRARSGSGASTTSCGRSHFHGSSSEDRLMDQQYDFLTTIKKPKLGFYQINA